jgi:hypothetical protein
MTLITYNHQCTFVLFTFDWVFSVKVVHHLARKETGLGRKG